MRSGALAAAIKYNLPIVANRGYLTNEILQHEKNIVLLDKVTDESIIHYVEKIYTADTFRNQLQQGTKELYEGEVSWTAVTTKFLCALNS